MRFTIQIARCVAILAFAAALAQAATVTLTWDNNTEPDMAGYNVWQQTGGSNQFNEVQTLGFPTNICTLTNLVIGTNYTFYVTAFNTNGIESDPSESVSWTPSPGVPPMLVVTTNKIQKSGTNWIINLAWNPSPPGYGVTNYQLSVWRDTNQVAAFSTTNTSVQLTEPIFSPTFIHLWATNYLGASPVVLLPYDKPASPRNMRVKSAGP